MNEVIILLGNRGEDLKPETEIENRIIKYFDDGRKEIYFIDKEEDTNLYINNEDSPTDKMYEIFKENDIDIKKNDKVYLAIHLGGKDTIDEYKDWLRRINKKIKDLPYKLVVSYHGSKTGINKNDKDYYKKIVKKIKSLVDNEAQENAEQIKFFYAEQKKSISELIKQEKNDKLKGLYDEFIRQVGVLEIKYNDIITEINK